MRVVETSTRNSFHHGVKRTVVRTSSCCGRRPALSGLWVAVVILQSTILPQQRVFATPPPDDSKAAQAAAAGADAGKWERPRRQRVHVARSRDGMVVSETRLSSEAGRDVLAAGGNAVDAAIATGFVLAVTWPEAGNIGGGGFMIVAPPRQPVMCVNYRETAPQSVNARSLVDQENRHHHRMVGVPGTVAGFAKAHAHYGKLPWKRLLQPAIDAAKHGVSVDSQLAWSLNTVLRQKSLQNDPRYAEFLRVFSHPDHRFWQAGDRLRQPDLAATLEQIAEHGADVFYTGPVSRLVVGEMQAGDGWITAEDLKQYRASVVPALCVPVGEYTVCGAPPPSSGGLLVPLQLRMLRQLQLQPSSTGFWTAEHLHLLAETSRRTFRDRAAFLGDPDFVKWPSKLVTREHAETLAATIDRELATTSASLAGEIRLTPPVKESPQTTHYSVVDSDGMAVSNTYTLENAFGSRIVVRGAGFLLNNEMGDFNRTPGVTDRKGNIGTPPNLVAPGKRMLSSQSPTIVRRHGHVVLVIGSPGGRSIINTVTQVIWQHLFFQRPLPTAIDGPRAHHQWLPDEFRLEDTSEGLFESLLPELKRRGHRVRILPKFRQGSAHGIAVDQKTGVRTGVADWRRGGYAAGVTPVEQ